MTSAAEDVRQAEGVLRGAVSAARWAATRLPVGHPLRLLASDFARDLGEALSASPQPGETWGPTSRTKASLIADV